MDGVQANGEPKRIFLSKSVDGNMTVEASTSKAFSVEIQGQKNRVYIPPSRRRPPPDRDEEDEHITNHKKQRYWNSYEEMFLVELWRRYRDEVTEYIKPLPVHRKIMVAMRQKEMMVTGQECRRKINTLNNRYKTELQSQKLTGIKPEWKLFPLIHCLKAPKIKQFDPWHETLVVRKLLEKIPKPPETRTVIVRPPVPVRFPLATTNIHTNITPSPPPPLPPPPAPAPVATTAGLLFDSIPPIQNVMSGLNTLVAFENCTNNPSLTDQKAEILKPYKDNSLTMCNITLKKLEQLQFENFRLTKERDEALKALKMAERNLRIFEALLAAVITPDDNAAAQVPIKIPKKRGRKRKENKIDVNNPS
ncbi:uncharacterized protein LOC106092404 [Stomoxys calcitrans]|uniref:Myb/SANT-like DNA-binding domain-containing protein n=1 Tax=Stomoxys calcitrans TaxID=35570 RepID=A0A1I8PFE3_STOCA|nr:uncharacterized protein LOC106092404 [Stomoxys calcitrans]